MTTNPTGAFLSRQSKYYYEIGFDILHPNEVASSVRNLRLAPYHDRTEALGAQYVPLAGYETPYFYDSNAGTGRRVLRPDSPPSRLRRHRLVADHRRRAPGTAGTRWSDRLVGVDRPGRDIWSRQP